MRSLCRSGDPRNGGNKTTETIVAEVVFDNAKEVGIGVNAGSPLKNGRAPAF